MLHPNEGLVGQPLVNHIQRLFYRQAAPNGAKSDSQTDSFSTIYSVGRKIIEKGQLFIE
jgi:hypothetical protein